MQALDLKGAGGVDDFERDRPAHVTDVEKVRAAFAARKPKPTRGGGRELTAPLADDVPPAPDELVLDAPPSVAQLTEAFQALASDPLAQTASERTEMLSFRCSDEERGRWHSIAESRGVTLSDLIRELLDQAGR